ncbi:MULTISPECIES: thermonuclease family protein [Giesbergeria]|uniref:Thermonuclease family protein n=1 Tax=Giesbergeria sinuosa TaxID=80883 RepID=A0ABV9QG07_9BURK
MDRVIDGDTISVRTEQGLERVRINQIDAPERSQTFGVDATTCLTNILGSGIVQMCSDGKDRYGRTIASVSAQGQDVGAAMVFQGCAWAYTKYLEAGSSLPTLQAFAQAAKSGLWASSSAQAPWQYRAGVGPVTATNGQPAVNISAPTTAAVHDRVFDWVEHKFPEFTAQGTETTSNSGAYGRCYASGLCVRYQNGRFLIVDQNGNATDAGSAADLTPLAASEGF